MQWNIEKIFSHKNIMKVRFEQHAAYAARIILSEVSEKEKDKSMTSLTSGI